VISVAVDPDKNLNALTPTKSGVGVDSDDVGTEITL